MSVVDPPLSVMTKYNRSRNVREISAKEIRYLSDRKSIQPVKKLTPAISKETFGRPEGPSLTCSELSPEYRLRLNNKTEIESRYFSEHSNTKARPRSGGWGGFVSATTG